MQKVFFLFFLLSSTYLHAAKPHEPTMYALIVGDTVSENIRPAVLADISNIERSLDVISQQINYRLKLKVLEGHSIHTKDAIHWLKKIPVSSRDIIFFFYSGHGTQDMDGKLWPVLWPRINGQGVSGNAVLHFLKKQKNRLSLAFFQACNAPAKENNYKKKIKGPFLPFLDPSISLPGLKTLFLHTRGLVSATAAKRGDLAWSVTDDIDNAMLGSIFTHMLVNSLQEKCLNENVSWEDVLKATSENCTAEIDSWDLVEIENLGFIKAEQHPFYQIDVK